MSLTGTIERYENFYSKHVAFHNIDVWLPPDYKYESQAHRMDEHMRNHGCIGNENWVTLKREGAEHSERSWRERVEIPLSFSLG